MNAFLKYLKLQTFFSPAHAVMPLAFCLSHACCSHSVPFTLSILRHRPPNSSWVQFVTCLSSLNFSTPILHFCCLYTKCLPPPLSSCPDMRRCSSASLFQGELSPAGALEPLEQLAAFFLSALCNSLSFFLDASQLLMNSCVFWQQEKKAYFPSAETETFSESW